MSWKQREQEIRDYAEFRYIVKNESPEQIADAIPDGPTASTIRRWANSSGWTEARTLRKTSGWSIAIRMRRKIEEVLEQSDAENRMLTPGEWDGIHKAWKMLQSMDAQGERASAGLDVLDQLTSYLETRTPALIDELRPLLMEFSRKIVKDALF